MAESRFEQFTWMDTHQWTIQGYRWIPENPKAIVHIVHGMTEHALRYASVAYQLNEAGIAVYAHDLRGHGETGKLNPPLGFIGNHGWKAILTNIHELNTQIQSQFPKLPVFMLGHSMGSYLTQTYAAQNRFKLAGILLSGSSFEAGFVTSPSWLLAKVLGLIQGEKAPGTLFYSIIYGGFNRKFAPTRTAFDWLSRDTREVQSYIKDPLCGFVPPLGFFEALFAGLTHLYGEKGYQRIAKTLPIYVFSGDKDPLGKNTKSLKKLISLYQARGNPIKWRFYAGGRHVMLAETNATEVIQQLITWISDTLRRPL